jgi:hypothetical protein
MQRLRAILQRATPVPESSVKPMGVGCSWSDLGKVSYTVGAADECLVPVLAICNNDAVSLLGGSGVLGDTAVALPMQTHCPGQTAFTRAQSSTLQAGTVRKGVLLWAAGLAALWSLHDLLL